MNPLIYYLWMLSLNVVIAGVHLGIIGYDPLGQQVLVQLLLDLGYIILVHSLCLIVTNVWSDSYSYQNKMRRDTIALEPPELDPATYKWVREKGVSMFHMPPIYDWMLLPNVNQDGWHWLSLSTLTLSCLMLVVIPTLRTVLIRLIWIICLLKLLIVGISLTDAPTLLMIQKADVYTKFYTKWNIKRGVPSKSRKKQTNRPSFLLHSSTQNPPPTSHPDPGPSQTLIEDIEQSGDTNHNYQLFFRQLRFYNRGACFAVLAVAYVLVQAVILASTAPPPRGQLAWTLTQTMVVHICFGYGVTVMAWAVDNMTQALEPASPV
jgi:hypothetical protein